MRGVKGNNDSDNDGGGGSGGIIRLTASIDWGEVVKALPPNNLLSLCVSASLNTL